MVTERPLHGTSFSFLCIYTVPSLTDTFIYTVVSDNRARKAKGTEWDPFSCRSGGTDEPASVSHA